MWKRWPWPTSEQSATLMTIAMTQRCQWRHEPTDVLVTSAGWALTVNWCTVRTESRASMPAPARSLKFRLWLSMQQLTHVTCSVESNIRSSYLLVQCRLYSQLFGIVLDPLAVCVLKAGRDQAVRFPYLPSVTVSTVCMESATLQVVKTWWGACDVIKWSSSKFKQCYLLCLSSLYQITLLTIDSFHCSNLMICAAENLKHTV